MPDLTAQQVEILKEINRRMAADSLQFSEKQKVIVNELNKRAAPKDKTGFFEAIQTQLSEGVNQKTPTGLSAMQPTDPNMLTSLGNLFDLPQDAAVATATTDKEGQPLEETFNERFAQGRDPSDVRDVGDASLVIPTAGPATSLNRKGKEQALDIILDPLNIPVGALGKAFLKAVNLGKLKFVKDIVKAGKITAKEVNAIKNEIKAVDSSIKVTDKDVVGIFKTIEQAKKPQGVPKPKGNLKGTIKKAKKDLDIPDLKNSDEGTAFGIKHQGDSGVIKRLKGKHKELDTQMAKLRSEKKYQEMSDLSIRKQATREAIEAAEKKGSFESYEKNILGKKVKGREIKGEPETINLYDNEIPLKEEKFNLGQHKKVVDAVEKVMKEKGIKRDKVGYPNLSDQMLFDVWGKGKIAFKDVKKYGVSEKEFMSMWREEITDSARRLTALSHAQRRLNKELGNIADEAKSLSNKTSPDWMAKTGHLLRRLDNVRRGIMVSQLSTAVRNATSQAGRIGLDVFDEALEVTLGKIFKVPGYDKAYLKDAFKLFGRLTKKNKDLLEQVIQFTPKEYDRMFMHYSDILEGTKFGDKLAKVEKGVQILNWANRLQEFGIRRAAFIGKLNSILDRKGINFYSMVKRSEDFTEQMIKKYGTDWKAKITPNDRSALKSILDIPKEDIEKSVDFALEMTFANQPKSKPAKAILNAINSLPFVGTGPLPFARFMMNAVRFNFEHSPLGFVRMLKPGVNKLEAFSRAATGSTLLYLGYELRGSKHAGEKWYELKVNGDTYDTRAYNPFAAYLFMGDVIRKITEGKLHNMTTKEFISGIASSNLRAGVGLWTIDKLIASLHDFEAIESFKKDMAEYAGGIASGYFQWFNQFNEMIAEIDPEHAKAREQNGFWGQIQKKIPGFYAELKELEKPTRKATPVKKSPLLKALTGFMRLETKNLLESELDRLGFKYQQIYPRVKDDGVNYLARREMGILAEEMIIPFMLSDAYRKGFKGGLATDVQKRYLLNEMLKLSKRAAYLIAIGKYEDARQIEIQLREKFRNKTTIEREFLEELTQ